MIVVSSYMLTFWKFSESGEELNLWVFLKVTELLTEIAFTLLNECNSFKTIWTCNLNFLICEFQNVHLHFQIKVNARGYSFESYKICWI